MELTEKIKKAQAYNNYLAQLAEESKSKGVLCFSEQPQKTNSDRQDYYLSPVQEETLFSNLRKNSFFGLINLVKTFAKEGNCVGLQMPMPNRTDTRKHDRTPNKGHISPYQTFKAEQVNIDGFISYSKIDSLADVLEIDIEKAFDKALDNQMLFSLLMVGFNGKSLADTSDFNTNPLAQDVAKGWLQKIRENGATQVITGATVGESAQYKNLNVLIKAALDKIPESVRMSGELVAICGQNLLSDNLINVEQSNFGEESPSITVLRNLNGGLKAISVPYFVGDSILITTLNNLSLYVQSGTIRRLIENNPSRDRIETYSSMVQDFIVEDYSVVALIDKIEIVD